MAIEPETSQTSEQLEAMFADAFGDFVVDNDLFDITKSLESDFENFGKIPWERKFTKSRPKKFIAYDLETTRIKEGTPDVRYLTAYGDDFRVSRRVDNLGDLLAELEISILTPENNNTRFIAWNGNGYDAFFVSRALLLSDDYIIRPYLTRSKSLRGLKVISRVLKSETGKTVSWEFLDGMSMTGLDTVKMKLSKFLSLFAPDFQKLELDFSSEEFDADNPDHVAYAERDAEGLYHAMVRVDEIARELTGNGLAPTMGNLAIKFFASRMPHNIQVWGPSKELQEILHGPAKRGGYCWVQRQYDGKVWKYDLNQAYAAAMRDAKLPCGSVVHTDRFEREKPGVYRVILQKRVPSEVPFYYRQATTNVGLFTLGDALCETWILSTEIEHLLAENWTVEILEGWYWRESFNMSDMVSELERLRFSDPQGPSGPLGTMVKTLGNSAYGKTLEVLEGLELVMSRVQPDAGFSGGGWHMHAPELGETTKHVWEKQGPALYRAYHQPQIGCFITAHVRLLVRAAALKKPDAFLYADTDCVVFSEAVQFLDVDPRRYGAWKFETDGAGYLIIGKKIYCSADAHEKRAKGLHIRELSGDDFRTWLLNGTPPTQVQTQRQNFVKVMSGRDMFQKLERRGTDVRNSKQAELRDGRFFPIVENDKIPLTKI